jgi:hypothetical protein
MPQSELHVGKVPYYSECSPAPHSTAESINANIRIAKPSGVSIQQRAARVAVAETYPLWLWLRAVYMCKRWSRTARRPLGRRVLSEIEVPFLVWRKEALLFATKTNGYAF